MPENGACVDIFDADSAPDPDHAVFGPAVWGIPKPRLPAVVDYNAAIKRYEGEN
jgi:hypothetical protein